MDMLRHALRAGQAAAPESPAPAVRRALVVGAGGPLGSAVLEQALARGGFAQVLALTAGEIAPALRHFRPLPAAELQPDGPPLGVDTAFVVFDRPRHANGRDEAFHRPRPEELPELAATLQARGVRRLLVVLPQATLLPQALREGLATLDEAAVAALGFEHLLLLRPAQAPQAADGDAPALQRLAHWLLRQLHWMVPQPQQPVRAATVASFAVALARALPGQRTGTRVVPAELVWQAAQRRDDEALARAWLAGEPLEPLRWQAGRM